MIYIGIVVLFFLFVMLYYVLENLPAPAIFLPVKCWEECSVLPIFRSLGSFLFHFVVVTITLQGAGKFVGDCCDRLV